MTQKEAPIAEYAVRLRIVARVHRLGMKYMMWFSVPFVGKNSRFAYERFKGMLLDDHGDGTCVLDPRYPEVRDYLAAGLNRVSVPLAGRLEIEF